MFKNFKLKLIFPFMLEYHSRPPRLISSSTFSLRLLPYGMGVLTSFLRQHNYYVEQEDLSTMFNYQNDFCFGPKLKNSDFDISKYKESDILSLLESGETVGKIDLLTDKVLDLTSVKGFNIIGFSIFSYFHFIFALVLSKKIKQITNTPIVFGGAFISLFGHLYPGAFNIIDYMIIGDGRIPLLKLIDYLNNKIAVSEVTNLVYKNNGKLISNPIQDYSLEDVPIPDFDILPLQSYKNKGLKGNHILLPYQITRGCTGKCSFCVNTCINAKLEFKSYNKVITELRQMKERYKSAVFHFCDDTINNSYEYLEGLCNLFIKNKLNINWLSYAKVDKLDKHISRKLKEAGCHRLLFGIESGSDRMLRMMNKDVTSEQSGQALKDAFESGLLNHVLLIVGYPHETKEDIKQTIKFIKENRKYIHYITINEFQLYYGTRIYLYPEEYGIEKLVKLPFSCAFAFNECDGLTWEKKQNQQHESRTQIIKAGYKYHYLEKFVRQISDIIFQRKRIGHLI